MDKAVYLLVAILFVAFISCNAPITNGPSRPAVVEVGKVSSSPRSMLVYNSDDRDIATLICYALKSRRAMYQTKIGVANYQFEISGKRCDNSVLDSKIQTVINLNREETSLVFIPKEKASEEFDDRAEVPDHGNLEQICRSVFTGSEMPEPVLMTSENMWRELRFFRDENVLGYEVYGLQKRSDVDQEEYRYSEIEKVVIITDKKSPEYGLVKDRSKKFLCGGSNSEDQIAFWKQRIQAL